MIPSLDQKLAAIRAAPQNTKEFILADAKDADMAFGVRAPGPRGYLARHGAGLRSSRRKSGRARNLATAICPSFWTSSARWCSKAWWTSC